MQPRVPVTHNFFFLGSGEDAEKETKRSLLITYFKALENAHVYSGVGVSIKNEQLKTIIQKEEVSAFTIKNKFGAATSYGVEHTLFQAVNEIKEIVEAHHAEDLTFNLMGFSRGAVATFRLANRLQFLYPRIKINIFAIDPVAGPGHRTDWDATYIPANVQELQMVLMRHEYKPGFEPQDLSTLVIADKDKTQVHIHPLPGTHTGAQTITKPDDKNLPLEILGDTTFITGYNLHAFLRRHGATFKMNSDLKIPRAKKTGFSEFDYLKEFSDPKKRLLAFMNMQRNMANGLYGMADGLKEKILAREFTAEHKIINYVLHPDIFVSQQHQDDFRQLEPELYNWYFLNGEGNHQIINSANWLDAVSALIADAVRGVEYARAIVAILLTLNRFIEKNNQLEENSLKMQFYNRLRNVGFVKIPEEALRDELAAIQLLETQLGSMEKIRNIGITIPHHPMVIGNKKLNEHATYFDDEHPAGVTPPPISQHLQAPRISVSALKMTATEILSAANMMVSSLYTGYLEKTKLASYTDDRRNERLDILSASARQLKGLKELLQTNVLDDTAIRQQILEVLQQLIRNSLGIISTHNTRTIENTVFEFLLEHNLMTNIASFAMEAKSIQEYIEEVVKLPAFQQLRKTNDAFTGSLVSSLTLGFIQTNRATRLNDLLQFIKLHHPQTWYDELLKLNDRQEGPLFALLNSSKLKNNQALINNIMQTLQELKLQTVELMHQKLEGHAVNRKSEL